ncbi:MAG TPA: efflux RND transporter periplasmic adaptor subunit [Azospirillaceae bacterium]|nr:efflux RND transporter periplasmic adaptor subunit [Azospirillaceae bacterium]
MNRSYAIAGAITVGAVLWVLSGQFGGGAAETKGPEAAKAEAPLQSVRVAKLSAVPMTAEVLMPGRTEASRRVDLRAEVRGRVAEVLAERGRPVREGDVVLRIEKNDREVALAQARALVAQRELEFRAAEQLQSKGFNSQVRYSEAKAALDAARASLRRAELDLANLEVRAPFDGVLNQRSVEVGNYVDVKDPVATLVDLDPLRVVGFATERDVAAIRVGGPGKARLVNGTEVEGSVTYVSSSADAATRTFRVEMEVANPEGRVVDGLTAELRLPVATRPAHLVSPGVLTLDDKGTIGVKLVDAQNVVQFVPVQLLGHGDKGVWLGGLPERITLITVGQDFVVAGQKVAPTEGGLS